MTGSDSENNGSAVASQVSHVAVKIPPLWKANIKLWFIQVESNFALAKVTNDLTKYNHLISSIDPETLSSVSDILFAPPETDKYEALKTRLITEFSASENEQMRRLISEMHLGDDKPSQFLRKMRELGGKSITDDFLKTLWLQRLPSAIQTILSISSESLDNLAKMADKISEVRTSTDNIFAVSQTAAVSADNTQRVSPVDDVSALRNEIAALSKQVERLARDRSRGPGHRNGSRHRSFSRGRSRERNTDYCFYHARFGKNARKCRSPCTYTSTTDQENSQ